MAKPTRKPDPTPPQWLSGPDAFKAFATHKGSTQSARHIKPLHWYIASRLVTEGGFHPDDITPRPPFHIEERSGKRGRKRFILHFDQAKAVPGEQIVLGGLKTKSVDVVVNKRHLGPVLAVSCKGVTKAFRNLTNRMEETIGECTNLHITYPAMVIGYFAVLRANRTVEDALEAPEIDENDTATEEDEPEEEDGAEQVPHARKVAKLKKNDIAVQDDGTIFEGIKRFHAALRDMTLRQGIRDEISRYEAMAMALVEPGVAVAGDVVPDFPPQDSPLLMRNFFSTLYQRYEERFVLGAPALAGDTRRLFWDAESPVILRSTIEAPSWPTLDYKERTSDF